VLGYVAELVTRRPRTTLALWALVMGLLAMRGAGLDERLSTQPLYVDGTSTQRAHAIVAREFGSEDAIVVMLRGPAAAIDRQGPDLAAKLEGRPGTLVVSPWDSKGTIDGLRPKPGIAALVVNVQDQPDLGSDAALAVRRAVRQSVSGPVRVSIAGGPEIANSLRNSIEQAAKVGQRLAIPVLLIVLLLVCRSLLAAAMPVVLGGAVVAATRGALDLMHSLVRLDSIALGVAGMLGLALGVDYSLLVVSRFREEMRETDDVALAVRRTVMTSGRAVLPAGGGLLLAMVVSSQLMPGSVLASVTLAAMAASVFSVLSALLAVPTLLMLFGARLDRWSLPRRTAGQGLATTWSRRLSSHPALVLSAIFVLVLCAGWAFALRTNIGTAELLPAGDPGRRQQESIERQLGPGWVAPLEVVMDGRGEPITTPQRLRALAAFQRRVEDDPGVATMAGFRSFAPAAERLSGVGGQLARQQRSLVRLDNGIARAQSGAQSANHGLRSAAAGASRLGAAVASTRDASGSLASGLVSVRDGSAQLSGGLDQVGQGSGKLTEATSTVSSSAGRLADGVRRARKQFGQATAGTRLLKNALGSGERSLTRAESPISSTEGELVKGWHALQEMTSGRGDPRYGEALGAVTAAYEALSGQAPGGEEPNPDTGVGGEIGDAQGQFSLSRYLTDQMTKKNREARVGIDKLAAASSRLDRGLGKLLAHSRDVSDGIAQLARSGAEVPAGLRRLALGEERLVEGLGKLEEGAGGLSGALGTGAGQSGTLVSGLRKIHGAVGRSRDGGDSQLATLRSQSPGLFRSGYFYLASLDGSTPHARAAADLLVNLDNGGTAARMLVISRYRPGSDEARSTAARVRADAETLGRDTSATVEVGGFGPALVDIDSALRGRAPIARLALSLVTVVIILLVTRSLALAIFAALLNLLTVSATFGLLALLFNGSLLGGPGYVDSTVIVATIVLAFGLSIDYEVFIFSRMREEYLRTGSTEEAIANAVGRTTHVITGAAVIMIAVFLTFAVSPLATLRGLGVALSLAIFIDAFLIRFIIVPATMRALGARSWWLPRWLDRVLPGETRFGRAAKNA
jgi:RND superfamily putative drug exporter